MENVTSLIELADYLNELADKCNEDQTDMERFVDMASLPTFGGEEPEDTCEIWSWDEDNFLVSGNGSYGNAFKIEIRQPRRK